MTTPFRLATILLLIPLTSALPAAVAEIVEIPALADATLIEEPNGALANGSGPSLFVGRTAQRLDSVRRAVVRFDVAAALPRQAIVEDVSLILRMAPSNPEPRRIVVHRVLAAWGEGPSFALGGSGALALPGDVTWRHTFYDRSEWVREGGQFVARISAARIVGGPGTYEWRGGGLLGDVRLWLHAPRRNFGWILIGDESAPQTVKRFLARESDPALIPVLRVSYRLPGRR